MTIQRLPGRPQRQALRSPACAPGTAMIAGVLGAALLLGCGGGGRPPVAEAGEVLRAENHPLGEVLPGVVTETLLIDSRAVQAQLDPVPPPQDPTVPVAVFSYLPGTAPTRLVVYCHGLNQDVRRVWVQHTEATVRPDTVAIASNYRDNERFPVARGAHDTIAAPLLALERFPTVETVYLFRVARRGLRVGMFRATGDEIDDVPLATLGRLWSAGLHVNVGVELWMTGATTTWHVLAASSSDKTRSAPYK